MTEITKKYIMNKFDPGANCNKVWVGMAFDDGRFRTEYGRVREGGRLAFTEKSLLSVFEAEQELEKKRGEKLRKGYRDTNIIDSKTEVVIKNSSLDLTTIAVQQIAGAAGDATTLELIKYLAKVNIHHITHSTSIRYDASNATFTTPLGIITPDAVLEARQLLGNIRSYNKQGRFDAPLRTASVRDYFQLVPKDFGMKIPPASDLLASAADVESQTDILDALEASLSSAAPVTEEAKIFECRLTKVPHITDEGRAVFRKIRALYDSTKNVRHHPGTANLKLTRVYEVEVTGMKKRFETFAAKIGNVRDDLWHGTKASNLLSILKNGLIIPPASAAHCTGRMFGNGVYTSLQSTKALNYATDYWNRSGSANQRTFMFLCEAALGKMYKPVSSGSNFPKAGTDSTWVEANTAGVINHECIVYDPAQINLKYLCEFGALA